MLQILQGKEYSKNGQYAFTNFQVELGKFKQHGCPTFDVDTVTTPP